MAFDGRELVTTAAVVIVKTDPGVAREVIFASFVALAGSRLDTGNIDSLSVCKQVGVETALPCSFAHKSFLLPLP